ncbi:hypothetical protein Moror_11673 [Moniliophthora roreri MCA 2997]|uniref:Uncharacterized protein n=2 Tax=Moniliophthora roreri TaxID=221103 RepID=V2WKM5_MONRO|nr:hypothetical protein Moror_11673 [Moniliophthora roreri MCA 2997]KAI3619832.1 hypothetical protein WG66_002749 [Moniliophthora roreri]
MKFAIASLLFTATAVLAQTSEDPYADYGVISPAAGTTISVNTPLNVTFNPHRYFKESARTIDVFLILGAEASAPKSGHPAKEVVTAMEPNIQVSWSGFPTPAYQVNIDLTQLAGPVPGERAVLIKERFNGFGGVDSTAYWSQTFSVTA